VSTHRRRDTNTGVRDTPMTAWFGKLPSRGDFVSGGMGAALRHTCDEWLQRGLSACARRLGAAECERRLRGFAPWRFLTWPDGLDGAALFGVLVPSHDRVGRAFPLLLLQPFVPDSHGWLAIEAALARLADIALDLTDPPGVDDFEAVLHAVGPLLQAPPAPLPKAPGRARREVSPRGLLSASPGHHSLWWPAPPPGAAPLPLADDWPPHEELLDDILATGQAAA